MTRVEIPESEIRTSLRVPHWGWFLSLAAILVLLGAALVLWLPSYQDRRMAEVVDTWGGKSLKRATPPDWLQNVIGKDRLKRFRVFDRIVEINLADAPVTDLELAQLINCCTNLESLSVKGREITALSLYRLSRRRNLAHLAFDGTTLTDSDLVHLEGMTNLRYLSVKGTAVTDAGLAHLTVLTKLEHLGLYETGVTDSGISELRKSLPSCNISY